MITFKYLWHNIKLIRPFKNKAESDKVFYDKHMTYPYIDWYTHANFYKEAEKNWCYECEIFYIDWKIWVPWEKGFMFPWADTLSV